jgi:chromosome segregation protein
MKIKRLEMIGFKSFVDRTVVTFDDDVLAIVGPNGCGKSNIVDAIRWCMGEQSAKHLRGRSMEDVIFSGSDTRAGHDFAEVTLTFDNEDGDVPIELKDYPQIAVTRRLHRSGDSEYLINKTQVRLKDITDLFLGTGAGTKAYSIIEQGKIGLIVSAKPEDRRLLIEEAAGITKYKSRKRQAEKKMELTQQNLLRVGDIVAEIERNLGSLKRQAAKAERYIAYRAELEDLHLYEASHKYLETVGWIKLETAQVDEATLAHDQARTDLVTREADLETVRQEARVKEDVLEQAHNASFAAENEVRAEEAAILRAKEKVATLEARAQQADGEAREIHEQMDKLAREREAVASVVLELEEEEAGQAETVAAQEAELGRLSSELQAAQAEALGLRDAIAKAQAAIASAEAKMAGFDRRRAEMLTRAEKLAAEHDDLVELTGEHQTRATQLAATLEDLRLGKTTSEEERQRVEDQLAVLRHEIGTSDRALDESKGELTRKRSRLHALVEMHARHEGVGAGVKALLASGDPAVSGLVADRMEAPHELVAALAGLLGNRFQDVVVTDMARGRELLARLGEEKRGRATIVEERPHYVAGAHAELPSDDGVVARLIDELRFVPEDEALVRSLVGDALVMKDVEAAERVRSSWASTLVTLDGTVLRVDGSVSGGTGEEIAAGMLESKLEARELATEVSRLDTKVTELYARHGELKTAIQAAQALLESARQKAHAGELAQVTCERDLRAAQQQLDNLKRREQTVATERSDVHEAIAASDLEHDAARQVLEETQGQAEGMAARQAEAEGLATTWRDQVDAQRHAVTEYKVRVAGTRERLAAGRGTLDRLARSTGELGERGRRLEEELHANAAQVGETAAAWIHHKELLGLALDEQRARTHELTEARAGFETLRNDLNEREGLLKGLRGLLEEMREGLAHHELALRERQLVLVHLLEGVAEKYRGLDLARVVGDYHMRPPPDEETHARAQELSNLIDRMGSVNLDAVREHEEAEKRYTFYTTQKADLDKALADLERAIAQMNRESRRLFQETFDAINLKFQEVFPRMFRGGRGSLRLTNPEDMLETGIDILAQPPGKKLSNIELMSGGEKALTAVSLIFAIFQIKPSPFCILDEVDAPLDEANVARYNEMIRSMTDRSQFILITHIKRTMQLADVLYGVTMQESGVSRLVSVKVNETGESKKPAQQPAVAVA